MTDQTVMLAELHKELAQLKDLFVRRLTDDKARATLAETLQEQIRAQQDVLRGRAFESLFRDALLAIDRLTSEPPTRELVESAVEELLEAFARRNLLPIDDRGEFDPRLHEVVGTVPGGPGLPAGSIVAVRRTGYTLEGRLLRPAQVTIAVEARDPVAADAAR